MAYLEPGEGGTADENHLRFHPRPSHRFLMGFVRDQRAMVTAEFAVVTMAVSLVMIMVVFAATVGVSYVKTQDTARQAARMIARGDPQSVAVGQAHSALPGSKVSVNSSSDAVAVHVSSQVSVPIANIKFGGLTVSSTAHAPRERHLASVFQ